MLKNIQLKVYKVWKRFSVPSETKTNVFYIVEVMDDGEMHCDCEAYKECKHIKQVKMELSGFTQYNKYSI